jgi:hypothetical protein
MARRLLRRCDAAIMGRSLVTAITIWAIGCVIPTPLETESGANHPPVIVSGTPDFTQGVVTHRTTDVFDFGVHVADQDLDQTLSALLYYKAGDQFIPLSSVATLDPATRTHIFSGLYCKEIAPETSTLVFVYASDLGFPTDFSPASPPSEMAGHFDYKYWVLDCM